MPNVHVVSDIHGYADSLLAAARAAGLVDDAGTWRSRDELWVLGDYLDRGPDGVGVIDLLRRWHDEAAGVGGRVEALLGNHEVLALGMRWFGAEAVPGRFDSPRSFLRSWSLNGGREDDQSGLREDHVEWLLDRPLIARVGGWLLMHSDTTAYLEWGTTAEDVNANAGAALAGRDIAEVWEAWRRLTSRGAFTGPHGDEAVQDMLSHFGGSRIAHGHSTIGSILRVPGPLVRPEPHVYRDGLVAAVDGGRHDGGPLIVARLDTLDEP